MEKKWGLNAWWPLLQPLCPPTCSSWDLITFVILTCHVQIFLKPGRFQNLPAHHPPHYPHHNPPSSPPSPMPPPILPPPPTTSLTSTPCIHPNHHHLHPTSHHPTTHHPATPTPTPLPLHPPSPLHHPHPTSLHPTTEKKWGLNA